MKPATPVILWAAIFRTPRCEWIGYHTVARTKRGSVAAYKAGYDKEHAERILRKELRQRRIRFARVVVSVAP